jgi:hypothetical protein
MMEQMMLFHQIGKEMIVQDTLKLVLELVKVLVFFLLQQLEFIL